MAVRGVQGERSAKGERAGNAGNGLRAQESYAGDCQQPAAAVVGADLRVLLG